MVLAQPHRQRARDPAVCRCRRSRRSTASIRRLARTPAAALPSKQTRRGWFEHAGAPDAVAVAARRSRLQKRPATKPNGADDGVQDAIDGIAYSLFMDGSIAAELPQGKVKFASVDELQVLTTR